MTPANRMATSARTRIAAGISVKIRSALSSTASRGAALRSGRMPGLSERAAVLLQCAPQGRAKTALPLLIEAGLHQRLAERSAIWVVEFHALRFEAGDQ